MCDGIAELVPNCTLVVVDQYLRMFPYLTLWSLTTIVLFFTLMKISHVMRAGSVCVYVCGLFHLTWCLVHLITWHDFLFPSILPGFSCCIVYIAFSLFLSPLIDTKNDYDLGCYEQCWNSCKSAPVSSIYWFHFFVISRYQWHFWSVC